MLLPSSGSSSPNAARADEGAGTTATKDDEAESGVVVVDDRRRHPITLPALRPPPSWRKPAAGVARVVSNIRRRKRSMCTVVERAWRTLAHLEPTVVRVASFCELFEIAKDLKILISRSTPSLTVTSSASRAEQSVHNVAVFLQ